MANTDTNTSVNPDTIIDLARDVGEVKGIVTSQAEVITDLSTRFNQFSAKMDKLIVYPVWAMVIAFIGKILGLDVLVSKLLNLIQ